jgi:hypothetical protein
MKQINESMNDRKMNKRSKLFPLAALALFAGACVVNVDDEKEPAPAEVDGERLVTLALTLPGSPGTRALKTVDENAVDAVDVFLFNATDQFCYRAIGSSITTVSSAPDPEQRQFNVRLPEGTWRVVVLANARAAIAASKKATDLVPATLSSAGLSRADVLDGIAQQLTNPASTYAEEFDRIPMWGYGSADLVVANNTPTPATDVALTRAIVRVDLSVKTSVQSKFSMTSAYLYNYNRAGSIAPAVSGAGYHLGQWDATDLVATDKHLPDVTLLADGVTLLKVTAAPVTYTIPAAQEHAFRNAIYTFEAEQGMDGVIANTCLVVGGNYKADASTPSVLTYYRVDFANYVAANPITYLKLLRNHHYDVEIQDVTGHGYPTPDEAYKMNPANIVVNIVPWNDGAMGGVEVRGQHYLNVDKSELVFYSGGAPKSVRAITDFPEGWTIKELPGWLEIELPSPLPGGVGAETKLTLKSKDTGVQDGYFYIVAGNLNKKIRVQQLDEVEFSLELDPVELTFYKTPLIAKGVGILSFPVADATDYPLTFSLTGNITSWDTPTSFASLSKILSTLWLKPNTNAGSTTLGGSVLVTLTDPVTSRTVTRVVNVKQLGREMLFTPTGTLDYPAAASDKYTFTVASEAKWQLAESETYLTLGDESTEHDPTAAFSYKFSLTSNENSYAPRVATVEVTSSDPDFFPASRSFKIRQAGTPPYINITEPTGGTYNFGLSDVAETVEFTTNAKWKFTTNADYSGVIKDAGGASANTAYDLGASPLVEKKGGVTFTPETDAGTEVAGTVKETTVTFTTEPATDAPTNITFSRVVPAMLEILSPAPSTGILAKKTGVTLIAKTNLIWWAQATDNTAPAATGTQEYSTGPAAYKPTDQITVTVPARPTGEIASWNSTGTVTMQAGYDALPGILAYSEQFTLDRPAYTLTVSNINPTTVVAGGGTVNVTFNSTADTYYVQWRNSATFSGSTAIGDPMLVTGTGVQTINYPEKDLEGASRNLYLYHATTNTLLFDNPVVQKMPLYWAARPKAAPTSVTTTISWNVPSGYTQLASSEYVIGMDLSDSGSNMFGSTNYGLSFNVENYFVAYWDYLGTDSDGELLYKAIVWGWQYRAIGSTGGVETRRYSDATINRGALFKRND